MLVYLSKEKENQISKRKENKTITLEEEDNKEKDFKNVILRPSSSCNRRRFQREKEIKYLSAIQLVPKRITKHFLAHTVYNLIISWKCNPNRD